MSVPALSSFMVMVCLTLFPFPARANSARAQNNAAKKACLTGDFRKGTDILAQLYLDSGDPTHLFNQGRCYERNHQWQEAVDAFREYLRKATSLSPADKADTEKHIAECEALLDKADAKRARPETPPPPALAATPMPTMAAAEPPVGELRSAAAAMPPPTPEGSDGSPLRIAGLVAGGLGLVAVGAGIGFNLKANQLADEVNQRYSRSKASTQSTYSTLGWVGYGVGAAAIAAGAALYAIGWHKGSVQSAPSARLALTPVASPGEAGFVVQGAF